MDLTFKSKNIGRPNLGYFKRNSLNFENRFLFKLFLIVLNFKTTTTNIFSY